MVVGLAVCCGMCCCYGCDTSCCLGCDISLTLVVLVGCDISYGICDSSCK